MVETNIAGEAKLAGPGVKMSDRHVIAETILRPGKLPRTGRDFELRFDDPLIVVVARTQHHPVLAECDRAIIVICGDVSDAENRHYRAMIMDTSSTSIATAINLHNMHYNMHFLGQIGRVFSAIVSVAGQLPKQLPGGPNGWTGML